MKRTYLFLILSAILFTLLLCACEKKCDHEYTFEITTKPTCLATGTMTYTCSKCKDSYTEELPITGHAFGAAVVTKDPTCTQKGQKSHTCTVCNLTEVCGVVAMKSHDFTSKTTTEPTCASTGVRIYTCSTCGHEETRTIPATGNHNYKSKVTKKPSCTDGVKTFTCTECSHSYTESIPSTGEHNYKSKVTKKATCEDDGEKTYTCTDCSDSYTETIYSTGHKWVEGTCVKAGYCSVCNETGWKKEHTRDNNLVCTVCGDKSGATFIIPDTPLSFISYKRMFEITSIETKQYNSYGDLRVTFTLDCVCTLNTDGNTSGKVYIAYKIYDSDGYVVESGATGSEAVKAGDKFKITIDGGYDLERGKTYTLELLRRD